MASYRIEWKRSATKEIRRLPSETVRKILDAVADLASDPFPANVRKLTGSEHTYRIRIGDYRIVYDIHSSTLIIEIVRVRHRKDAYD